MRWRTFSGALDARILIDFFQRLTRNAAKKIFLILDNLRVHHANGCAAMAGGERGYDRGLY